MNKIIGKSQSQIEVIFRVENVVSYYWESELRLYFDDNPNEYMIIIYDDHCSFQRCGSPKEQSGECNYKSLDELYKAQQIDDIILDNIYNGRHCYKTEWSLGISQPLHDGAYRVPSAYKFQSLYTKGSKQKHC